MNDLMWDDDGSLDSNGVGGVWNGKEVGIIFVLDIVLSVLFVL